MAFNSLWSSAKNSSIDGTSQSWWWEMIPNRSRGLDTNFVSVAFWGRLGCFEADRLEDV